MRFFIMVSACAASLLTVLMWEFALSQEPAEVPAVSTDRIRADVKYLSSDQLEGRGLGGRGEELATDYIAQAFKKAGLQPAGDRNSFFQKVALIKVATEPQATLVASKDGQRIDFRCEDDFAGQTRTQAPIEDFDAEAVFLGHGIVAPEYGWNDYRGADVKGKIVIVFTNEPPSDDPKFFRGKELTYYGRWSYKFEEAARQGAKAVFIIHTLETAGYPYSVVRRLEGVQTARAPEGPALAFAGWFSRSAGEKLLDMAGKTVDGALKEARTKGFQAVPLGIRLKGHIPSKVQKFTTKNVVGMVPGDDPELAKEAVLFTAHWDHLGLGKAVLGDNIYNGAADNATGCGFLLEMARAWAAHKPRPKRSAIFLATTAEENGLLGAYHYAQHPVLPLGKTALNLNFDTIFPMGVPESVIVNGAERTTAWPMVRKVAQKHKLAIEPDSFPEQGMYYRSDHFALARGGVPAFSVFPGSRIQGKPPDYAKKAFAQFNKERYHTPQDEYREDWDFSGFPTLVRFAFDVALEAANQEGLPTWRPGDEFLPARQKSGVK